ncbi:MAG: relaxase domain-containing protein [Metallibacterium scheffleri]|uniref:MobF family relaxase n=1 Tax=Metallibacterium scheffleri TaxID=993689 RepID=UPI0026ECC711|nr:MobF family relaxase [Metallibacterium scheffleri]MCK9366794.1 relaxase domain-containing protein [Metallibacterium scheffleri]
MSAIRSSDAAASYYAAVDDYYRDGDHAPTRWQGRGAELLGLHGSVQTRDAAALLDGRLPNGEVLGRSGVRGEHVHRPGWDATFSAPKSVSVAALVHGDERLIAAHDQAVAAALAHLEQHAAATRIRTPEGITTQATGNLVIATYRHSTSREAEPQLHTHAVITNATRDAGGQWRSLESRPLYRLQIEAGEVYRNELAREALALGYTVERTQAGNHASFELREVNAMERAQFSSRSAQIEAALAARGKDRETATAREKETATLDTRQAKGSVDHAALREQWRDAAREAGHTVDQRPVERTYDGREAADASIRQAAEHLSERQARFSERELLAESRRQALGSAAETELRGALTRANAEGALVARETRAYDVVTGQRTSQPGYATREGLETEQRMLALANASVGRAAPSASRAVAEAAIIRQEQQSGHAFNAAQRETTVALLTGTDRVTLVQGYAGTAKTTSVLAATADELRQQGWKVEALAPTRNAAETLGRAVGAEGRTVAAFLHAAPSPQAASPRTAYLVDEASLLSARDMTQLLDKTHGDRVVLVGDVKQLGSIEAGAAFRQLQEHSAVKTSVLDVIVRQKDEQLRAAVYDALRGDPSAALAKVNVRQLEERADRVAAIARDYAALSPEQRAQTLVIAPGRDDRAAINMAIRGELAARGELIGPEARITVLERQDLTRVQARQASSYHEGDVLRAGRNYASLELAKGDSTRIVAVDTERNRLTLERHDGPRAEIDPARYARFTAWTARELAVQAGDRITLRETVGHLKGGAVLTVEHIEAGVLHVRDAHDGAQMLDTTKAVALDYAYAQTAHQAQGSTCTRVLVHAESDRVNLMNQQSLYVALSRATHLAVVYTDDQLALTAQVERESGQKESALTSAIEHTARNAHERATLTTSPWISSSAEERSSMAPWEFPHEATKRSNVIGHASASLEFDRS